MLQYLFDVDDDRDLLNIQITDSFLGYFLSREDKATVEKMFRDRLYDWINSHDFEDLTGEESILELMKEFSKEVPMNCQRFFSNRVKMVPKKSGIDFQWMLDNGLLGIQISLEL